MKKLTKTIVRLAIVRCIFGRTRKIVIASNGRAGSTMLFDAIAVSLVRHKLGLFAVWPIRRLAYWACKGFVARIACLPEVPFVVCKTHDTFTDAPPGDHKYVFVYADPLESALSVGNIVARESTDWFRLHQYHLRAVGKLDQLYAKDILNYAGQLTSWLGAGRDNVLCVCYDDLWARQTEISKFLGFPIIFPRRRERTSNELPENISFELFSHLRKMKSEFESKINRNSDS